MILARPENEISKYPVPPIKYLRPGVISPVQPTNCGVHIDFSQVVAITEPVISIDTTGRCFISNISFKIFFKSDLPGVQGSILDKKYYINSADDTDVCRSDYLLWEFAVRELIKWDEDGRKTSPPTDGLEENLKLRVLESANNLSDEYISSQRIELGEYFKFLKPEVDAVTQHLIDVWSQVKEAYPNL